MCQQKEELFQQSEEIASQRDELEIQNAQVTKAFNNNKLLSEFGQKITAKLNAKTIQTTIYEYISSLINISIVIGNCIDHLHGELIGYIYYTTKFPIRMRFVL